MDNGVFLLINRYFGNQWLLKSVILVKLYQVLVECFS